MQFDSFWVDANLATVHNAEGPYGIIRDGAVGVIDGRVAWVGRRTAVPADRVVGATEYSCEGAWLTTGLVDCHTHLVFGGNRAEEFERLLEGERYEDIAAQGGGIRSTVRATREATFDQLLAGAEQRVRTLLAGGVTTVEVKSGYGLDLESEVKMLEVARALDTASPCTVRTTLLAAHATPAEFTNRDDDYIEHIVNRIIPAVVARGLADQVDAFVETIAFTPAQARRVLEAGRAAGLGVRIHADQITESGGGKLAAELGAASADHVEHTSESTLQAMADAGVAAVLLPGAYYTLGDAVRGGRRPDVGTMRAAGVDMAVATDLNPGSSPLTSLTAAMNMACTLFGLRPHEALAGATRVAGRILRLPDRGMIAPGFMADFALWSIDHPRELSYWVSGIRPDTVWIAGEPVGTHG